MENNDLERFLVAIGSKIQKLRTEKDLQPEDIAEMTGLTAPTIRNIENGSQTYLGNYIAVCLALGVHPKEVLDIKVPVKPLFELSDPRKEKTRLTARIESFIQNNFFDEERSAKDVLRELETHYNTQTTTSAVSVILSRKVDEKELVVYKLGKKNVYRRRQK